MNSSLPERRQAWNFLSWKSYSIPNDTKTVQMIWLPRKHREGNRIQEYLTAVFPNFHYFQKRQEYDYFPHHLIKLEDRKGLQTKKNSVKINFKKDNFWHVHWNERGRSIRTLEVGRVKAVFWRGLSIVKLVIWSRLILYFLNNTHVTANYIKVIHLLLVLGKIWLSVYLVSKISWSAKQRKYAIAENTKAENENFGIKKYTLANIAKYFAFMSKYTLVLDKRPPNYNGIMKYLLNLYGIL